MALMAPSDFMLFGAGAETVAAFAALWHQPVRKAAVATHVLGTYIVFPGQPGDLGMVALARGEVGRAVSAKNTAYAGQSPTPAVIHGCISAFSRA